MDPGVEFTVFLPPDPRGRRLGAVGSVERLFPQLRRRRQLLAPLLLPARAAQRRPLLPRGATPLPLLQGAGLPRPQR